jgi:molybdenum cofactor biosynthesis enzyme MoaA
MIDPFGRAIRYVRISVTDRCNLRCTYCMPDGYVGGEKHEDILSYEGIGAIAEALAGLGVQKFRLTGGEPLVRRELPVLVRMLAALPGVSDVALSTNAVLLRAHAGALAAAGLKRVNVSLDTLDPATFKKISVNASLEAVLDGIAAAEEVGLTPIKLNMVVMKGVNDHEIEAMARLTFEKPWTITPSRDWPAKRASTSRRCQFSIVTRIPNAASSWDLLRPMKRRCARRCFDCARFCAWPRNRFSKDEIAGREDDASGQRDFHIG